MDEWSTLKQTGTAEEYIRRVDELAVLMPLSEAAEFAHALRGMRTEIRAAIQFRLEEVGSTSCSREELWRLMWLAETRYPYKPAKPFFPRSRPKPHPPKASAMDTATPTICWICDTPGHRANACPRRHSSGCARCGSKAHNLLVCPQRQNTRRSDAAKTGNPPGGKKRDKNKSSAK